MDIETLNNNLNFSLDILNRYSLHIADFSDKMIQITNEILEKTATLIDSGLNRQSACDDSLNLLNNLRMGIDQLAARIDLIENYLNQLKSVRYLNMNNFSED